MPIYEYQCKSCGKIEEALQKFSEKPLSECKHCPGKLHKLISHSAFHLKGSGWYVTDYAGNSQKDDSKSQNSLPDKKENKSTAADSAKKTSDPD
ncbi:MAG: zinc ribbon domain-containing protein [Desulfobacteraceae bacterium]|nr:zinc ribbon domain-containing protein [Desulfobacteraceae bacterium]